MKDIKKMFSIRCRILLSLMVVVFFWSGTNDAISADDFGPILGRWQRVDGGYVIEVRHIQADGQMDAGYYNPGPLMSPGPRHLLTVIKSRLRWSCVTRVTPVRLIP